MRFTMNGKKTGTLLLTGILTAGILLTGIPIFRPGPAGVQAAGGDGAEGTKSGYGYSQYETETDVPEEGMYEITVEYIQPADNVRDIIIDVEVNGSTPFEEASGITLPRIYKNEGGIRTDANGNEIAPRQVMVLEPVTHTLMST